MASRCGRTINRASFSSLRSAVKSMAAPSLNRSATASFSKSPLPSAPTSSPLRRFSLSRVPLELGGVQTMMPLHSAVATARMTSCLSSTSRSCRALSQAGSISSEVTLLADGQKDEAVFMRGNRNLPCPFVPTEFYQVINNA